MPDAALSLGQKQRLFSRLLANLILHIYGLGYEVTLADGNVDPIRKGTPGVVVKGKFEPTGQKQTFRDEVHLRDGQHYNRLAQDLNLFIEGEWIEDGDHPAWSKIGPWWEAQHSLARWGGRFKSRDSNHYSLTHAGKA